MKSGLANVSLSEVLESPSQWLGSMFWALRGTCFFLKRGVRALHRSSQLCSLLENEPIIHFNEENFNLDISMSLTFFSSSDIIQAACSKRNIRHTQVHLSLQGKNTKRGHLFSKTRNSLLDTARIQCSSIL